MRGGGGEGRRRSGGGIGSEVETREEGGDHIVSCCVVYGRRALGCRGKRRKGKKGKGEGDGNSVMRDWCDGGWCFESVGRPELVSIKLRTIFVMMLQDHVQCPLSTSNDCLIVSSTSISIPRLLPILTRLPTRVHQFYFQPASSVSLG